MNSKVSSFLILSLGAAPLVAQADADMPGEERRVVKVLRTKGRLPSVTQPPAPASPRNDEQQSGPSEAIAQKLSAMPPVATDAATVPPKSDVDTGQAATPVIAASRLTQRIVRPATTATKPQQITAQTRRTQGPVAPEAKPMAPLTLSSLKPLATTPLAPLAPLSSTTSLDTGPSQSVSPLGQWLNKGFGWVDSLLGVKPVKPWQKATLAEPAMSQGGVAPTLGKFATKVFISKEASLGGNGVAGGGCGCK